jgi:hypothetical protein
MGRPRSAAPTKSTHEALAQKMLAERASHIATFAVNGAPEVSALVIGPHRWTPKKFLNI